MEIPDTVSVRKFNEFNARQKHELYETLLELGEALDELPKKSLRKTLELTLAVLHYKGKQAEDLQNKINHNAADGHKSERRLYDENEKLKRMVQSLEDERDGYKQKTKELSDEILRLQQRLQEAAQQAEGSDKDSSDPLSELDTKEQLLLNIDAKNKHIKRLLRDLESQQNTNIAQAKSIATTEQEMRLIKENIMQLSEDITEVEQERKKLQQKEQEHSLEIVRLESNINFLEDERDKQDKEMRKFIEKYKANTLNLKSQLELQDKELKRLRKQLERANGSPSSKVEELGERLSEQASINEEQTKMRHLLETREKHIEQLESQIKSMSEEIVSSTKVMNRLCEERERSLNRKDPHACCKLLEENLKQATARSQQLSELLETAEQDNVLKAKQALHAINALEAFKRGEDGLVPALRKCTALEQKLAQRDKQLRSYVQELNSMHEITQENLLLRRKLKIPDEVVVVAKNLRAKERNKDKQIERLMLKLRTSEELRVQLKLDKCELRRQLLERHQSQPKKAKAESPLPDNQPNNANVPPPPPPPTHVRVPSEVGEIASNTAQGAVNSPKKDAPSRGQADGAASSELQSKYDELLAENETLRIGMHEILEKLRDYDATSDHITIDSQLLQRLLNILPSADATSQRLHIELRALRGREEALRQLLLQHNVSDSESTDLSSVHSMRDVSEMPGDYAACLIDTATRPATPNDASIELQLPVIAAPEETPQQSRSRHNSAHLAELQQQLSNMQQHMDEENIYKKHYEELKLHIAADDNELKSSNLQLNERLLKTELELSQQSNSYGYMRRDYDQLLSEYKQQELRYINDTTALKRQVHLQQVQLQSQGDELNKLQASQLYSEEDLQQVERRNALLSTQLAQCAQQLSADQHESPVLPELCVNYGIVDENYQIDYITAEEYENQRRELDNWREKQAELQREIKQLEGLLEVANEQIHSQQKLLNEITDNHISLRHLVADLQSLSEDKLLLAKMQRDVDSAKAEVTRIALERNELLLKVGSLQTQLQQAERQATQTQEDFQLERRNQNLKHKFLKKSLFMLKEKYAKFTPLIFLTTFVFTYNKYAQRLEEEASPAPLPFQVELSLAEMNGAGSDESEQLIKLIKAETQIKLLEQNCESLQLNCVKFQRELVELRLQQATEAVHWHTIEALFGQSQEPMARPALVDVATNTADMKPPVPAKRRIQPQSETGDASPSVELADVQTSPIGSPARARASMHTVAIGTSLEFLEIGVQTNGQRKFHHQAVQTLVHKNGNGNGNGKNEINSELKQLQTALKEAKQRIAELEISGQRTTLHHQAVQTAASKNGHGNGNGKHDTNAELRQLQAALREANQHIAHLETQFDSHDNLSGIADTFGDKEGHQSGVVERTIMSFHSLLMEKDSSIQKYQDLLQTERDQSQHIFNKLSAENDTLRATVHNLNFNIKTKDGEIFELKSKIKVIHNSVRRRMKPADKADSEECSDNSLNVVTDEKIEEMFENSSSIDKQDIVDPTNLEVAVIREKQDTEELKELPILQKQIKKLKDKLSFYEKSVKTREEEIDILKEKLRMCKERDKSAVNGSSPEVEQMRAFLEEKDKHIHDLMDTLKSFHDDQQRYINDTSNFSAEQIAKLASDLNRTEAANKIYHSQIEALRRQVHSLTQREKQARDISQSLRTQLIKRPVVSIKTELNARTKNENMQKRIQQLELELEESRAQLQRQQVLLEAKRARSANEVGLWDKQKRWQQNAEKYKSKLEETEVALEKSRTLLQAARTTNARLEKDKHILEVKLGRAPTVTAATNTTLKCCRTPSCPNLQHVGAKFTPSPSESPDTYTGPSSECSSPAHQGHANGQHRYYDQDQADLIEALKSRIEMQQRKIIAMELEGRGTNALTTELEKLQERFQAVEAENIRLEARNLQLQLDADLMRQGDNTERLQKRIKHLEDYIIALKEEMARADSRRDLCKCSGIKVNTQQGQPAEQTILSLRNLVEKLRSENKFLKDGRRSSESRGSTESTTLPEVVRLRQQLTEALEKVAALQQDTELSSRNSTISEELGHVKEQLVKKMQLLQKAKVLLGRAAAKEKLLKEQIAALKRKCSELQNVPVIDEISE